MPVVQPGGPVAASPPVARCDLRGAQARAPEHHRIVEITSSPVVEVELRERQRQPAAAKQRRQEPLSAKARELFDHG